jgi:hypothetical protein
VRQSEAVVLTDPARNDVVTAEVSCPNGAVLLGGGGEILDTGQEEGTTVAIEATRPTQTAGWVVVARVLGAEDDATPVRVRAYALCTAAPA